MLAVSLLVAGPSVKAAQLIVNLYVDLHAMYQQDGSTVLADGSYIQIIQSTDAVQDGFGVYGNDHWVITSTQGDDVIIANIPVGLGYTPDVTGSGLFFWSSTLDIDVNNTYFYIRFFNYPLNNLSQLGTTNLYWGTSTVYLADTYSDGFSVDIDFSSVSTNLVTSQQHSFVVIPEPSSISFFALVGGMAVAMRSQIARRKRREKLAEAEVENGTGTDSA